MAKFGYETIGGSFIGISVDAIFVARFQLTENGDVTKITWYGQSKSGTNNMIAIIYDDASGQPNILKGTSQAVAVGGTAAWRDFTFSTPISLTAGYYWLGILCDNSLNWFYNSGGTNAWEYATYPTPPNPFGSHTDRTDLCSIYATYTPAAAAGLTGHKMELTLCL